VPLRVGPFCHPCPLLLQPRTDFFAAVLGSTEAGLTTRKWRVVATVARSWGYLRRAPTLSSYLCDPTTPLPEPPSSTGGERAPAQANPGLPTTELGVSNPRAPFGCVEGDRNRIAGDWPPAAPEFVTSRIAFCRGQTPQPDNRR
jgi:hypothetical protein